VVELSCYYPSKDNAIFDDAIIFANLRGDACKYTKQVDFIENISFISFILMSKKSIKSDNNCVKVLLQKLARSPGGLVILLTDAKKCNKEKIKEVLQCDNFSLICISSKPFVMIQQEIRKHITCKLQSKHSHKYISISGHKNTACKLNIIVDEDDPECVEGKEKALRVMKHAGKSKHDIFPLQGPDLWGKWATYNKERYRHKCKQPNLSVAEYMQTKYEEKTAVRLLQFHCNFSKFTAEFLVSLMQSRNERSYFLHWLKECLIDHSKDVLPTLEKEYEKAYMEIKSTSEKSKKKKFT